MYKNVNSFANELIKFLYQEVIKVRQTVLYGLYTYNDLIITVIIN